MALPSTNAFIHASIAATLFFVVYVVYKLISSVVISRRLIKQHGCEPIASHYRSGWRGLFMGLDFMDENFKAAQSRMYLKSTRARFERLGTTWTTSILGERMIQTVDPANIKAVLSTNFSDWWIGACRADNFRPILGNGIFAIDGHAWRHSRNMLRPAFVKCQVADLSVYEKHIQKLIGGFLTPSYGTSTSVDLQPLFFRLTMDSSTDIIFGKSVDTLRPDDQLDDTTKGFGDAYETAKWEVFKNITLHPWGKLRFWSPMHSAIKVVHKYIDDFVDQAAACSTPDAFPKAPKTGSRKEPYSVLREVSRSTTNKQKIRGELLSVLLAGRDTTAALLSNVFFVLARRADIVAKIRDEIAHLDGNAPTIDQLKHLDYVHAVLKESLRLHPVAPVNTRVSRVPTILPTGGGPSRTSPVYVPAGTQIVFNMYTLHRLPSIWGPDAEEFRPERWMPTFSSSLSSGAAPSAAAAKNRSVWEFMPFLGGPRMCPGQGLAMTEAAYTVVRLLQAFEGLGAAPGEEALEWQEELAVTCCNARGCRVVLTTTTGSEGDGVSEMRVGS